MASQILTVDFVAPQVVSQELASLFFLVPPLSVDLLPMSLVLPRWHFFDAVEDKEMKKEPDADELMEKQDDLIVLVAAFEYDWKMVYFEMAVAV